MRGASITGYAEAARRVGLDPRAMLHRYGIDRRVLTEPELRMPADAAIALIEGSAEASGCETFGLLMTETRKLSDYGPISLLFAHQPTLHDMLDCMIRYQRMLNDALVLEMDEHRWDTTVVRQEILTDFGRTPRQCYELAVATLYRTFRGPRGPRWRARSIHFTHGPPSDLAAHRRAFDAPVEFYSDFNGFTCAPAELKALNPLADAAMARHAEGFIQALPRAQEVAFAAEVERAIQVLLPFNGASIETVSARLGLNRRTLQRRLAQEGAEFSALLNQMRRRHAIRYLANPRLPVAQVAGLVGYSHETSFARWFSGEFGRSPSAWRAAPT